MRPTYYHQMHDELRRRSLVLTWLPVALIAAVLISGVIGCMTSAKVEAKAPVLSPELSAAISNHVSATIQQELDRRQTANSGPQNSSGEGNTNIGAINMGDSTAAIVAVAVAAVIVCLWRAKNGYRRTVDVLVKDNIEQGITKDRQNEIQNKAVAHRAEKYLKPRVHAMRKEMERKGLRKK